MTLQVPDLDPDGCGGSLLPEGQTAFTRLPMPPVVWCEVPLARASCLLTCIRRKHLLGET
jgi:hypothetical protein